MRKGRLLIGVGGTPLDVAVGRDGARGACREQGVFVCKSGGKSLGFRRPNHLVQLAEDVIGIQERFRGRCRVAR